MTDTEEAMDRWGSAVYRAAYVLTRSRQDADDILSLIHI